MRFPRFIFYLMGLISLPGCSKPKPRDMDIPKPRETEIPKPDKTVIPEEAFNVVLPGEWSRRSEEDGLRIVYSSATGREQLTVSLMPSSQRMTQDLRFATFNRVLELRRQAETDGLAPSAVTMTAPIVSEQVGIHSGRYGGFEAASQRRFSCLLICSSSTVATFYYEAIGRPQNEADARASSILDSARLTK